MDISVIVPIYNEKKNVPLLYDKIFKVLKSITKDFEIIFIDDGSTDGSYEEMKKLRDLTIIKFRKNFGQSAAMDAGFHNANGKIIISMDGDLQNDPSDIPRLLKKLKEKDLDVVCGWRYKRKDTLEKRIFSIFANAFRNFLIKDPVHDSGCSLRAYKRECFEDFDLMGEMHRYIPSLLRWKGFKIGEEKVSHHKRKFGKTKYSLSRVIRGFLDLFVVWFWRKFSGRPVHIFGGLGIITIGFGILTGLYSIYLKIIQKVSLSDTFLPDVAVFSIIIGIQFFISGIMTDIAIKNYYKCGNSKIYNIHKIEKR
jgi:glycosyltransferase involved in cell wall biosynthesis